MYHHTCMILINRYKVTTLDYSGLCGSDCDWQNSQRRDRMGQQAALITETGEIVKAKITKLMGFDGLKRVDMEEVAGNIVAVVVLLGQILARDDYLPE